MSVVSGVSGYRRKKGAKLLTNKLREYFPMIRSREELRDIIAKDPLLEENFTSWSKEEQKLFLDMCTGVRGLKMLYDGFFKELFDPEYHKERLEQFLSLILGSKVMIRQILTNDSVRLADENTLLITDIIVELADGSLANLEIQKMGYAFPGQRIACYGADMLLRQYKRVKNRLKKKFTYRKIKNVYVIVLFEKSPKEFRGQQGKYMHHSRQKFDTGLNLNLLQEYILISLDIFKENFQNRIIETELEAWLAFLTFEEPDQILELLRTHPEFEEMYREIYELCRNVEGVMDMFFSEELRELDRNTVQYMMEEQEKELEANKRKLKKMREKIRKREQQLQESEKQLREKEQQLAEKDAVIRELMGRK